MITDAAPFILEKQQLREMLLSKYYYSEEITFEFWLHENYFKNLCAESAHK